MSYLLYSQIWLNLLDDDRHFFCVMPHLPGEISQKEKKIK
jgi:hypothetical protein